MALSSSSIPGSSLPTLAFHATSHPGLVHPFNGDSWQHISLLQGDDLFVVADGFEQQVEGRFLSQITLTLLQEALHQQSPAPATIQLDQALEHVHQILASTSASIIPRTSEYPGCQVVGIWIDANHQMALGFAVGQGRAYLFRDMTLMCLTQDPMAPHPPHEQNALSTPIASSASSASGSCLGLGSGVDIRAMVQTIPPFALHPGDLFLLCTDGIAGQVTETEIAQILAQHRSGALNQTCQHLVFQTLHTGGTDNATVLLVEVPGATPPPLALTQPFAAHTFSGTQPYLAHLTQLPMTQEQLVLFHQEHVREHRYQRIFLWLTVLLCLLLFTYFMTSVGLEKSPTSPRSAASQRTRQFPAEKAPIRLAPARKASTPGSNRPPVQTPRRKPSTPTPVRLDLESLPFAPHIPMQQNTPTPGQRNKPPSSRSLR